MPFQDARELTRFADLLATWRAPEGVDWAVAIACRPPGPQASNVAVTLSYGGNVGAVAFNKPVRAREAFRSLNLAASVIIRQCPERN